MSDVWACAPHNMRDCSLCRDGVGITSTTDRDEILAKSAWATMKDALVRQMPQSVRESIGSKAVDNAHYIGSLETVNASRVARGERPISMSMFLSGTLEDEGND